TLQPTPSNVVMCVWYRASDTVHSSEILSYAPSYNPPQSNGTAFTGRETGGPGCSMHIRDLWMNDTSAYTVQIWNPGSTTASTNLTVYGECPAPKQSALRPRRAGEAALTCDPPASTETLLWLRDGVLLAAGGRLALSDDNRTLTVTPAARTDAGAYVCEARNPVSSNRSEATNVTVACESPRPVPPLRSRATCSRRVPALSLRCILVARRPPGAAAPWAGRCNKAAPGGEPALARARDARARDTRAHSPLHAHDTLMTHSGALAHACDARACDLLVDPCTCWCHTDSRHTLERCVRGPLHTLVTCSS
uniref:Ig-like domain-containing protein n=1 Tax=Dromaius novaehollandiae TaxID=8790 RepID=A0A8C4KLP2_DRONO